MRRALLLVLAALLPGIALAQNEVYDPEPPRGSAYLRFVNALPGAAEIRPDFLSPLRLGAATTDRVGAYTVVERVEGRALSLEVREGGRVQSGRVAARPDGFVTVLLHAAPDGAIRITALAEEMNFNRARVRLGFYNALPGCDRGGLRLDPDGPAVFENVPGGEGRQRTVNAVRATVRAGCAGGASTTFPLEGLEAGASFSTWLMPGPGDQPRAFLSRDVTTPWRR